MSQPVFRPWTIGAAVFIISVCMSPLALVQPIIATTGHGALLWYMLSVLTGLLGVYANIAAVETPLAPWAQTAWSYLRYGRSLFFVLGATAMLTVWLNILSATELPDTPRYVSSLLTIVVVAYALRLGIQTSARLAGLLGFLVAPGLVLILVGVFPEIHPGYLMPDFLGSGQVPWLWPMIVFMPRGYDILPVVGPHTDGQYRTAALVGVGAAAVYLLVSMITPALVFGFGGAARMSSPFLQMIGIVSNPFLPFQRLAFVSFIIWQMICFSIVLMYSICGLQSLGVRVHPLTPMPAVLIWMAAVFVMSLFFLPTDIFTALKVAWSAYGLLIYIAAPLTLLAFGRRRVALA